jgi:hypothetical protein
MQSNKCVIGCLLKKPSKPNDSSSGSWHDYISRRLIRRSIGTKPPLSSGRWHDYISRRLIRRSISTKLLSRWRPGRNCLLIIFITIIILFVVVLLFFFLLRSLYDLTRRLC